VKSTCTLFVTMRCAIQIIKLECLTFPYLSGYSRIPIYDCERRNIVTILFTKDLMFVEPDDKIPLKTLAQFYNNPCYYVFSDTTLDIVFKEFKECKLCNQTVSLSCHVVTDVITRLGLLCIIFSSQFKFD